MDSQGRHPTMSDITTVSLQREDKPVVEEAQERLEDELGVSPTLGETVAKLCREFVEDDD